MLRYPRLSKAPNSPTRPRPPIQLSYSFAMKRIAAAALLFALLAAACGGSDADTLPLLTDSASSSDSTVDEADDALPSAVAIGDPDDPDAPLPITFGGFFYSDGTVVQLCSSLAESFPPQCGLVVIDIAAPVDVALQYVAESFPNPDDAKININQGIYWTDDWVNLSGTLQANRLVLE